MKIKIITGFREDQFYTIDIQEAHKAYHLFLHPNERGVFSNGVAIRGIDIKSIEPDYHSTMGWNPTHQLDSEDWNEIRGKRVDVKMRNLLAAANQLAKMDGVQMNTLLSDALKYLPPADHDVSVLSKELADHMRIA